MAGSPAAPEKPKWVLVSSPFRCCRPLVGFAVVPPPGTGAPFSYSRHGDPSLSKLPWQSASQDLCMLFVGGRGRQSA